MTTDRPKVIQSVENDERNRCVDIVLGAGGRYGFQEWRREPEDPGNWSLMRDGGGAVHDSAVEAVAAARCQVPWFATIRPVAP